MSQIHICFSLHRRAELSVRGLLNRLVIPGCQSKSTHYDRNSHLRLVLLRVVELSASLHQILLDDRVTEVSTVYHSQPLDSPVLSNSKHSRFRADVSQIRSVETVGKFHDSLVIDISALVDALCVNFENFQSTLLVRQGDLDLPIQTTGTQ